MVPLKPYFRYSFSPPQTSNYARVAVSGIGAVVNSTGYSHKVVVRIVEHTQHVVFLAGAPPCNRLKVVISVRKRVSKQEPRQ